MFDEVFKIRELIRKEHIGSITAEEMAELEAWRQSYPQNEATYNDLQVPIHLQEEIKGQHKYQQYATADFVAITTSLPKRAKVKRIGWIRAVAAAAILFAIAGISYWIYSNNDSTRLGDNKDKTLLVDKLPGYNNARLTLSDGRVFDLDKTKPGLIAKKGNSSVRKTEDGRIVYETGKSSFRIKIDTVAAAVHTLETPAGGQYPIVLNDGTKVFLNSVSKLDFPEQFAADKRIVRFSGEGYFEVAKDNFRPFFVIINGQEIRVTGTKFTISAYDDERFTMTTLVEGGIKISNAPKDRYTAAVSLNTNPNSIAVKPGQAVVQNKATNNFKLDKNADVEAATAFVNGEFVMNNGTVGILMRQLARWYNVQLKYENGYNPDAVALTGAFDKNQKLSSIIRVLNELGIKARQEQNTLILTQ